MTHTYVECAVSHAAHREIEALLRKAGYDHAIEDGVIDMHGLALVIDAELVDAEVPQGFTEAERLRAGKEGIMSTNTQSMESITDVREMRRILTDMRYGGYSPFTKGRDMSPASGLVRHVMAAAQHLGWSGEDMMTALAYHALLQLDEAHGLLSQHYAMTREPGHFIVKGAANG